MRPLLPLPDLLIYEAVDNLSENRFLGCFHNKARGEALPNATTGRTQADAREHVDGPVYECAEPPVEKLRFIVSQPDGFQFLGNSPEAVITRLETWWLESQTRIASRDCRTETVRVKRPNQPSATRVDPDRVVALVRTERFKNQAEVASELGSTQTKISAVLRTAVEAGAITREDINRHFQVARQA